MNTVVSTKRILVVDDERAVCNSVEKILVRRGHDVEKALSVAEAVTAMQGERKIDLILADLMMPQAGGLDLLRAVKDRWPGVPVVIMTGYASIATAIEATQLGAAGYVPKPFTPDELEAAVERASLTTRIAARPAPKAAAPAPAPVVKKAETQVIDVDMPFDAAEVAAATSPEYVKHLTRSDMPVVDFCDLGQRTCKRFKTKGVCKQPECPLVVSERRKRAAVSVVPQAHDMIDVDMPFSLTEVAGATSEAYAYALGRGDMPVTGRWDPTRSTGRKVLVVDDEAVVANSIRRTLSRRGFAVEEAFSVNEALNRILNEMYDLVLLDMKMPDANGLDLLPTIKRHRPALPVVMVTGYASIDTAVEAIQRGASDYMAKPFTPDELFATANRAIKAARA
jgi:DNA-binding response OmpR family regulator